VVTTRIVVARRHGAHQPNRMRWACDRYATEAWRFAAYSWGTVKLELSDVEVAADRVRESIDEIDSAGGSWAVVAGPSTV